MSRGHRQCVDCEELLAESDASYVVHIEVFAAADPLELGPEDLDRDLELERARLARELERADPAEATADVYTSFTFRMCRRCRDRYVTSPLPAASEPR